MSDTAHIITLPGDGIGPEIMDAAKELMTVLGGIEWEDYDIGGVAIDNHGNALPDATLEASKNADAVLLAAVGGPKWDSTNPDDPRPEQGLLGIRKGLDLFANLRPVKPIQALYGSSPLKEDRISGTDLLVIRELDRDRRHPRVVHAVQRDREGGLQLRGRAPRGDLPVV